MERDTPSICEQIFAVITQESQPEPAPSKCGPWAMGFGVWLHEARGLWTSRLWKASMPYRSGTLGIGFDLFWPSWASALRLSSQELPTRRPVSATLAPIPTQRSGKTARRITAFLRKFRSRLLRPGRCPQSQRHHLQCS